VAAPHRKPLGKLIWLLMAVCSAAGLREGRLEASTYLGRAAAAAAQAEVRVGNRRRFTLGDLRWFVTSAEAIGKNERK
jgi:hypothetical protein